MQGRNYYPVLLTTSAEKKWFYFTVTLKRIRAWLYSVVFWIFFTFSFCTDDVLLLLQGYNNPKWWSHSNVFRIHSRDRTSATSVSGKRPEDQIRCCCWQALPGNIWGSHTCRWVTVAQRRTTCPLNTSDRPHISFSHQQLWKKAWWCKPWWKDSYLFGKGHRLARLCLCTLFSCRHSTAHWCCITRA